VTRPGSPATGDTGDPRQPVLRVISGDATDEEIAALLAVVIPRGTGGPADDRPRGTSTWSDRRLLLHGTRHDLVPGHDAWRTSTWPR
jgi:hypothetical protein